MSVNGYPWIKAFPIYRHREITVRIMLISDYSVPLLRIRVIVRIIVRIVLASNALAFRARIRQIFESLFRDPVRPVRHKFDVYKSKINAHVPIFLLACNGIAEDVLTMIVQPPPRIVKHIRFQCLKQPLSCLYIFFMRIRKDIDSYRYLAHPTGK